MKMTGPWFLPLSWLFGIVVWVRNFAYARHWLPIHRAGVPILSIGNLSTGGTGKTPLSEFLLQSLSQAGHFPAYLSRGYGRHTRGFQQVEAQQSTARLVGDEALQVANKFPDLPVAVCENRVEGVRRLQEQQPVDLVVLDDAFQHRRLARDLDWVVIDAQRLPLHDRLLPAGQLREPLRALRRADLVIVNKVYEAGQIPRIRQALAPWGDKMAFCRPQAQSLKGFSATAPAPELTKLGDQPVLLFSGLGNPDAFARQVTQLGAVVKGHQVFRDPYRFNARDLDQIRQKASQLGAKYVISSEKDYWRIAHSPWLAQHQPPDFYYLTIRLVWWEGEEMMREQWQQLLSAGRGS